MIRTQVLKHLPGARERGAREEMSGEKRLRRVGISRPLRGEEIKTDGPIEYFPLTGIGSTF